MGRVSIERVPRFVPMPVEALSMTGAAAVTVISPLVAGFSAESSVVSLPSETVMPTRLSGAKPSSLYDTA